MSENPSDGLRIEQSGAEARRQLASVILSAVSGCKNQRKEQGHEQGKVINSPLFDSKESGNEKRTFPL